MLLGQLQLLSRDLGETLIIVECYYVPKCLFHFVSYFAARNSYSVFGRERLTTCSLTLGLVVILGCFQVVLNLEEISHLGATGTSFYAFWQMDIFSGLMLCLGEEGLYQNLSHYVLREIMAPLGFKLHC